MTEIPPEDAAKAVAHPLRASVLAAFDGEPRTPVSIADELGVPLTQIAYHVHALVELGALELTRTEPRRGALAHFYRAKWRVRVEAEVIGEFVEVAAPAVRQERGLPLSGAV